MCSSSSTRVPTSASLTTPVAASTVVDGLSPPSAVTIHSSRVPTPSVNISSSLAYNDYVCNPSAVNVGSCKPSVTLQQVKLDAASSRST